MVVCARDEAVAQVFAFLVAGALFVASMGVVLLGMAALPADEAEARGAVLESESAGLLARFLDGQPVGSGDEMVRLGLNDGDVIDPARVDELRGARIEAAQNGRVDYEEARRSLGYDDEDPDFHLRMLPTKDQAFDLSDMRTAYVADMPDSEYGEDLLALNVDPYYHVPAESVLLEIEGLVDTGVDFQPTLAPPTWYLPDLAPAPSINGGTFGDIYSEPTNGVGPLGDGLHKYDAVVIGSKNPQNTFDDGDFPEQLKDWVMDGGILVVLGSEERKVDWLQPLLDAGQTGLMGSGRAPDPDHAVWRVPNRLTPSAYEGGDFPYQIASNQSEWDLFDHVVVHQTAGSSTDRLRFAVSKDGAFGEGSLALSTYFPVTGLYTQEYQPPEGGGGQAKWNAPPGPLIENLLVHAHYKDLFLEYGPDPPKSDAVISQTRIRLLDSEEQREPIIVQFKLLTWYT